MVNLSWVLQKLFEVHAFLPRLRWRDGRAFLPIHLLMEVTYRCNLRCNFCQYLDIIEGKAKPFGPSSRDLPLTAITRWLDELPSGRLVTFAGGETLVRKDFPEILAHAAGRHRVHVITNGALIDEYVAQRYVGMAPRHVWQNGVVLVEVSLQGTEALHDRVVQRRGSWRQAIDGIEHLVRIRGDSKKFFPTLDLKLVVTRDTLPAMVEYMHLAKRLRVDLVNFLAEHDLVGNAAGGDLSRLMRPQRQPQGVDPVLLRTALIRCYELERELGVQVRLTPQVPIDEFVRHYTDHRTLDPSEYVCEGVWSRLAVGADGRNAPMCHYAAAGDMRRQTIREAWNSERFRAFRRATRQARIYPGCNGCCNLKYVGRRRLGLDGLSDELHAAQGVRTAASAA
jgi:MoaA/NifB/PqqE/SkfB family radical SAM enzyme